MGHGSIRGFPTSAAAYDKKLCKYLLCLEGRDICNRLRSARTCHYHGKDSSSIGWLQYHTGTLTAFLHTQTYTWLNSHNCIKWTYLLMDSVASVRSVVWGELSQVSYVRTKKWTAHMKSTLVITHIIITPFIFKFSFLLHFYHS